MAHLLEIRLAIQQLVQQEAGAFVKVCFMCGFSERGVVVCAASVGSLGQIDIVVKGFTLLVFLVRLCRMLP